MTYVLSFSLTFRDYWLHWDRGSNLSKRSNFFKESNWEWSEHPDWKWTNDSFEVNELRGIFLETFIAEFSMPATRQI